jgi:hypothetical protein
LGADFKAVFVEPNFNRSINRVMAGIVSETLVSQVNDFVMGFAEMWRKGFPRHASSNTTVNEANIHHNERGREHVC